MFTVFPLTFDGRIEPAAVEGVALVAGPAPSSDNQASTRLAHPSGADGGLAHALGKRGRVGSIRALGRPALTTATSVPPCSRNPCVQADLAAGARVTVPYPCPPKRPQTLYSSQIRAPKARQVFLGTEATGNP